MKGSRRIGTAVTVAATGFSLSFGGPWSAPAPAAERDVARPTKPSAWQPWLLDSADQFRAPSPPRAKSRTTKRELRQIRRIQDHLSKKKKRLIKKWNGDAGTLQWTEVALDMITVHRPGAFPTRTARALGLLHIGLYDAMVAAWDSRVTFKRKPPFAVDDQIERLTKAKGFSYPDVNAAIAGAAERILAYLFPQEPADTFARLAMQAASSRMWAGVSYRSDVQRGRVLGQQVADVVIAYGEADGHKTPASEVLTARLCQPADCDDPNQANWVPTPPAFQYPPTDPAASRWRTWLLSSPDQFRPALPFTYGDQAFCNELAEVRAANDSADESQKQLGFFWDDGPGTFGPAGHWNDIAVDIIRNRNVSTEKAARIFALMNAAIVDAFIAVWDAKYAYWTMRPVTAITDRPSICGGQSSDSGWVPNIFTPPFPSFPSGHTGESAAAARVLQYFFPDKGQNRNQIVDDLGPAGSFDEIAEEVALSRMLSGIHFRSDNEQALILGRRIAALAISRAQTDGSNI
jgi:hypothetical protein